MWKCKNCGGTDVVLDGVQGTAFGYRVNLDRNGDGELEVEYIDVMDYGSYQCVGCMKEDECLEDLADWVE